MILCDPVVPCHPHMRHFTRYEDPFFSKMSHCANAIRSAFVASAGRQMVSSAGSGSESTNGISVTHGSTGRLIPGGRSQRRSNCKVAVTLDQLVTLTVNSGVYFEGIGGLESPENESVGHSQTRPESGRISGMKVTQASPQIYRQTYCQKKTT